MGNFRRDTKGYHYTIPEAFDPSLSYDMQYQRLRNIVLKIIDEMEINVPYLIMTNVTHTNDSITITGSLYQDYKFVSLNNTFSLVGLGDGTYYLNLNNRHKYAPCDKDIVSVPFEGTMYVSTQYMPKDELTLYSITKENGVVTEVKYNDIYTGMHNVDKEAHENRFSDVYTKIADEITRALNAEKNLDEKIDSEIENLDSKKQDKIGDNNIGTDIFTIRNVPVNASIEFRNTTGNLISINTRPAQENNNAVPLQQLEQAISDEHRVLTNIITAETERAKSAEQDLDNKIDSEIARATASETKITGDLNTEIDRAQAKEAELQNDISNEETARINADNQEITNRTEAINAERIRAEGAESALQNAIDTEEAARESGDSAERKRATAAEANLQDNINNEVARATSAENLLQSEIDKLEVVAGNPQEKFADVEFTPARLSLKIIDKDPLVQSIAFANSTTTPLPIATPNPTQDLFAANKGYVDNKLEETTISTKGYVDDKFAKTTISTSGDVDVIGTTSSGLTLFTTSSKIDIRPNNTTISTGIGGTSTKVSMNQNGEMIVNTTNNATGGSIHGLHVPENATADYVATKGYVDSSISAIPSADLSWEQATMNATYMGEHSFTVYYNNSLKIAYGAFTFAYTSGTGDEANGDMMVPFATHVNFVIGNAYDIDPNTKTYTPVLLTYSGEDNHISISGHPKESSLVQIGFMCIYS